jgi:hypothetical protein
MDDLPPYKEPPFPVPEAERCKLFDWMVLTCYPGVVSKLEEAQKRREHLNGTPSQVTIKSGLLQKSVFLTFRVGLSFSAREQAIPLTRLLIGEYAW